MKSGRQTPTFSHALATILLIAIASAPTLARKKIDVIVLENGDTVTGEIKSLGQGLLMLSTDFMGTVSIEWEHIREVQSTQIFEVETVTGARYFGPLSSMPDLKMLTVPSGTEVVSLQHMEVVRVDQIESSLAGRLNGSMDFGYSFARAKRETQLTLNADSSYRTRRYEASARYGGSFSRQKDQEDRARNDLLGTFSRRLKNRWFLESLGQYQKNDELGLERRTTFGGGVGRDLVQNNRWEFSVLGGAGWTRERFTNDSEPEPFESSSTDRNSAEGLGVLTLKAFRYDQPKMNVALSLAAIPSLSQLGRLRLEFNASLRFELFKDFFWGANAFDSFDSDPPDSGRQAREKNDFGVSTSIGYSF